MECNFHREIPKQIPDARRGGGGSGGMGKEVWRRIEDEVRHLMMKGRNGSTARKQIGLNQVGWNSTETCTRSERFATNVCRKHGNKKKKKEIQSKGNTVISRFKSDPP